MKVLTIAMLTGALSGTTIAVMACGSDSTDPPAFPVGPAPTGSRAEAGTSGTSGTSGMSSGTSGMPAPTATAAAFCAANAGLFLDVSERCCSAAEKAAPSYVAIKASYQQAITECTTTFDPSVKSGRVKIDAAALTKCSAAITALACVDQSAGEYDLFVSCAAAVSGTQALAAACRIDAECQTGMSCVGFTTTADGTCQTPPIGSPCGHAPVADGGAFPTNATLAYNVECAGGGRCTNGTCVAAKALGAACTLDSECSPALACHLGKCSSAGRTGLGTTCTQVKDCKDGLYCTTPNGSNVTGTCETQKSAATPCSTTIFHECAGDCTVAMGSTTGSCTAVCGSN
jgi:hypothetical protein